MTRGLGSYAAGLLAFGGARGAAVALTSVQETTATYVYGQADPELLWPIGSIGKSFTAIIALQLANEGALSLDAPVTEYLPWFSVRSSFAPITIHHLLTHSAGLVAGPELAPGSIYDVVALRKQTAAWAPGARRWYSNVGYRAVGAVLEAATGRSYGQLVQERILDPLDMKSSAPVITNDIRARTAAGWVPFHDDRPWRPEDGLAPAPWIESADADGCVCCCLGDLATYARALWREDPRLLDAAAFARMKSPLMQDEPHGDGYGYGLVVSPGRFGHGGGMIGYVSFLEVDEKAGIGAVAVAGGVAGAAELGKAAIDLAAGRDLPDPEVALVEPLVDDGSCPPDCWAYLGRYRAHNPWLPTFRVVARDRGLVLGADWLSHERQPLVPVGNGLFRVGEWEHTPEWIRFDTLIEGRALRAVYSGAPYYRAFTE